MIKKNLQRPRLMTDAFRSKNYTKSYTKEHEYLSINYPTVLDIPEVGQMAEQVKDAILKSDITDSVASYQILRNELKNHEITRPNVMDLLWPYIKRVYD